MKQTRLTVALPARSAWRALVLLLAGLCCQHGFAEDFVWSQIGSSGSMTVGGNWTNGVAPTPNGSYTDTFIITNDLASPFTANVDTNYNLANLVATNSGTALRTITIFNTKSLSVNGTAIIGSNTLLNIGSNTAGGSTFSNNHLFLQDNAQVIINGGGPTAAGTLTVGGLFTNSSQSTVSASGAAYLQFASASVTNAGTMAFLIAQGAAGNQMLTLLIGANSNAFLVNNGTLVMGLAPTATDRKFAVSNQFDNAATGLFLITNAVTSATANTVPNVVFTGATRTSGGASTNSGTLRLVSTAIRQSAGTLTFLNGDFVNLGTLTWNQITNTTASFTLAEAGAVFSNAAGAQVITEAGGTGTFSIRADNNVNLGTHLLNAGVLQYQNRAGAAGSLQNAGTLLYNGGFLSVAVLTNTSSGVITNSQLAGGTMVWANTLQNFGLIHTGTGVLTNTGTIFMNGGSTLAGQLTNAAGSALIFSNGTATFAGTLANGGTVLAARGSTNAIAGYAWNGGTVTITNSVLAFTSGGFNANTLNLMGAGVLNIGGTNQASANASFGTFTNIGTVNFNLAGGGTINASTNGVGILNQGTLLLINNNSGATINGAVINATTNSYLGFQFGANNAMTFSVYSVATNFGTLYVNNVNEGLIINTGNVFNGGTITVGNGGSISLPGVLTTTGTVNLVGLTPGLYAASVFNETNGVVSVAIGHINAQTAALGSAITNAGVIKLIRGTTEGVGSVFQPDFGSTANPTPINNSGTLVGYGLGTLINSAIPLSWLNGRVTNGPTGFISSSNGAVFVLSGLAINQGTIQVESNSVFGTTFASRSPSAGRGNPGNWDVGFNTVANDGSIVLKGGYFGASTLSNAAGTWLIGNGSVGRVVFSNNWDLAGGYGFVVTPGIIVNAGTIMPAGVLNAGNITNLSGGTIIGQGVIQSLVVTNRSNGTNSFNTNGQIFNAAGGTVLASGGTLVLSNGFSAQNGTIGATAGAILQLGDGTLALTNNGTIALSGGELRAGTIVNNGSLLGNGLITGNVTSSGTNSPGFSVGTLSITGSLTLASTAVTWMELAGNGSNDLFIVSGALQYGGQLIVTNSTGFTFAAGQSFQLFQFGAGNQSGDFATTNLPDLLNGTLVWDTAHLNDQGILSIAIIPEPSALVLVGLGMVGLLIVSRHRR